MIADRQKFTQNSPVWDF